MSKAKAKKDTEKTKQNGPGKKVTIQEKAPPKEIELPGNKSVVGFAIRVGQGKDTKKV